MTCLKNIFYFKFPKYIWLSLDEKFDVSRKLIIYPNVKEQSFQNLTLREILKTYPKSKHHEGKCKENEYFRKETIDLRSINSKMLTTFF